MSVSSYALTVFVAVQMATVAAIGTDYLLIKAGLPAISDVAVKYPAVGVAIVLFLAVEPVTMGLHFLYYPPISNAARVLLSPEAMV